jgi:hypothetical protein
MTPRALRVFLSSTFEDLPQERRAVGAAIALQEQAAVRMETWGARPRKPLPECLQQVRSADAVVLVVAHRYGWVPDLQEGGDGEKSVTWLEVETAALCGKPILPYLLAPDSGADDRPEALERFRGRIRSMATPDYYTDPSDLQSRATAALGRLSNAYALDFGPGLRIVELRSFTPSRFHATGLPRAKVIARSLKEDSLTIEEVDSLIDGEHTGAAKLLLESGLARWKTHLNEIQAQLRRAADEESKQRQLLSGLSYEQRPQECAQPVLQASNPYLPEDLKARAQEYDRQQMERYQDCLRRYQARLTAYEHSRARIAQERERLDFLQHQIADLKNALTEAHIESDRDKHALEGDLVRSRDRDIAAIRWGMVEAASRSIAQGDVSNGFLLTLGCRAVGTSLQKHLSGEPSAELVYRQIGVDAASLADETTRAHFAVIGRDALGSLVALRDALWRGQDLVARIARAFNSVPGDVANQRAAEAARLLNTPLPTVPDYEHERDPMRHVWLLEEVEKDLAVLCDVEGASATLLTASVELRQEIASADTEAAAFIASAEENASRAAPIVDDALLGWLLLVGASSAAPSDTMRFCCALASEAVARVSLSPMQLIERCKTSTFAAADARACRDNHPAVHLELRLLEVEALKAHAMECVAMLQQARRKIPGLAETQVNDYRRHMTKVARMLLWPFANLLAALLALRAVKAWSSGLGSSHPHWKGLAKWSSGRAAAGLVAASLWTVIPLVVLFTWSDAVAGRVIVVWIAFVANAAAGIVTLIVVLRCHQLDVKSVRTGN